jgi:hypothetical protein
MGIKFEAIASNDSGSNQALAIVAPEPIVIPGARPSGALVPKLIADAFLLLGYTTFQYAGALVGDRGDFSGETFLVNVDIGKRHGQSRHQDK